MRRAPLTRLQAGFTLLELLLVVTVAGIMAGLAVMAIGGNAERELRRDVARIQQVMRMAADEAQFNATELGLWIAPDGSSYGFYTFDEKELEWIPYEGEGFRTEPLPAGYRMEVALEGEPIDLAALYREVFKLDETVRGFDEAPFSPLLIFFSDGDYTPFRLWVTHPGVPGQSYLLQGDGLGDIRSESVSQRARQERERD